MSSIFQWLIYFLLRSEASNKAKPTITRWNKEIRTAYGNSLLPAIFYIRTGELCSPAGRDNSMVNPHVFIQGLKTGERSSPLQWFPHQPQARFRCKACPNNTGAKRYQLFTGAGGLEAAFRASYRCTQCAYAAVFI